MKSMPRRVALTLVVVWIAAVLATAALAGEEGTTQPQVSAERIAQLVETIAGKAPCEEALKEAGAIGAPMVRPLLEKGDKGWVGHAITCYIKTAAIPELLRSLRESDEPQRKISAWALSSIIYYHGTGATDRDEIAAGLAKAISTDTCAYVRQYCATAAGTLKHKAVVPALLPMMDDKNIMVRAEAMRALGAIAPESSPDVLAAIEKGLADPDGNVRELSYETLADIQGKDASARLVAIADQNPGKLPFGLSQALMRCDTPEARRMLLKTLEDANARAGIRENILKHFRDHVEADQWPPLGGYLDDKEWKIRAIAAQMAGTRGDAALAPRLRELVDENVMGDFGRDDNHVRQAAIEALGKLKDAQAVPVITKWIRTVPVSAINALKEIGTPAAHEAIYEALSWDLTWTAERFWQEFGKTHFDAFLKLYDANPLENGDLAARLLLRMLENREMTLSAAQLEERTAAFLAKVKGPQAFPPPVRGDPSQVAKIIFYEQDFVRVDLVMRVDGRSRGGSTVLYRLVGDNYLPVGTAGAWRP